jgi:hypothetical protein
MTCWNSYTHQSETVRGPRDDGGLTSADVVEARKDLEEAIAIDDLQGSVTR